MPPNEHGTERSELLQYRMSGRPGQQWALILDFVLRISRFLSSLLHGRTHLNYVERCTHEGSACMHACTVCMIITGRGTFRRSAAINSVQHRPDSILGRQSWPHFNACSQLVPIPAITFESRDDEKLPVSRYRVCAESQYNICICGVFSWNNFG